MDLTTAATTFLTSPDGLIVSVPALVVGLWLLVRGFVAYRDEARVGDVATSRIASLAAGEVRLSGIVEAAEMTLVSPLQSVPCVYYRARIREERQENYSGDTLNEENAISFRVRDASGTIRVMPRGRVDWNVPPRWEAETDLDGDDPPGLNRNRGASTAPTELDREVGHRRPADGQACAVSIRRRRAGARRHRSSAAAVAGPTRRRASNPARRSPSSAPPGRSATWRRSSPTRSPTTTRNSRRPWRRPARSGRLATTPEEAWGNAAIPGFGIGQPTRPPELDRDADAPPIPSPRSPRRPRHRRLPASSIEPDELVVGQPEGEGQLVVYPGTPAEAVDRERGTLLVGLLGAVLAIGAALLVAAQLSGVLG